LFDPVALATNVAVAARRPRFNASYINNELVITVCAAASVTDRNPVMKMRIWKHHILRHTIPTEGRMLLMNLPIPLKQSFSNPMMIFYKSVSI
jgi:hypothetical protein